MERRSFLKGAGVVTVVAAGGGVWRAHDQGVFSAGDGPAYEPWKDWRTDSDDGVLPLVRAAILAASPHNTQPWLFRVTSSSIELWVDMQRNVGGLDPYLREEHIGLGCALENLLLAAAAHGYSATVRTAPGKLGGSSAGAQTKLVARVDLASGIREESELYDAIPRRHTNRSAYLPEKAIPLQFVDTLSRLASAETEVRMFLFSAKADRQKIVAISAAANTEIYSIPDIARASDRWIRLGWSDVQKYRDGLTIDAFGLPPLATGVAKMMPLWVLQWMVSRGAKKGYAELMMSAPLIGMVAVRDRYDQEQCLKAGRIWQRAHLLATARGVAARPCNEAVEMIDHEKAAGKPALRAGMLGELLRDNSWQSTFVFYMGYPTWKARASPRRAVEKVVL